MEAGRPRRGLAAHTAARQPRHTSIRSPEIRALVAPHSPHTREEGPTGSALWNRVTLGLWGRRPETIAGHKNSAHEPRGCCSADSSESHRTQGRARHRMPRPVTLQTRTEVAQHCLTADPTTATPPISMATTGQSPGWQQHL